MRDSQVLEIPSRERLVGNDLDLALTLLRDDHGIAQVSDPPIDLDLVVKELLESRDIEDLVRGRLRGVDDKLSVCERGGHSHNGAERKEGRGPLLGISLPCGSPWPCLLCRRHQRGARLSIATHLAYCL